MFEIGALNTIQTLVEVFTACRVAHKRSKMRVSNYFPASYLQVDHVVGSKDSKKEQKGVVKEQAKESDEIAENESKSEKENKVEVAIEGAENKVDGELVGTTGDVDRAEDEEMNVKRGKKQKFKGPLFDPKAEYSWKMCSTRNKHNYIPCIILKLLQNKSKVNGIMKGVVLRIR
ncbi:probable methyltransferase PMT28 isoform X1 [Tanacetum coccineum]